MSNIYIQEPPTNGKVLLKTTVGDIDIELWSKEAPKACRNFVQLCLEGYYDHVAFHRVVKDFIVQGGDPTETGEGGESVYGAPFKDEFHSRLRFVRRGLVAMANAGPNNNGSQFFFTMGTTPELQNKHTIFGKVVGDTLYNMLKLQEVEIDANERPLEPHRILHTEVLANPFDDIIPRQIKRQKRDKDEDKKIKSKSKATKNFSLLSFGEEAEEDEEQVDKATESFRGKSKSSHDLTDDPRLSSIPAVEEERKKRKTESPPDDGRKKEEEAKVKQDKEADGKRKLKVETQTEEAKKKVDASDDPKTETKKEGRKSRFSDITDEDRKQKDGEDAKKSQFSDAADDEKKKQDVEDDSSRKKRDEESAKKKQKVEDKEDGKKKKEDIEAGEDKTKKKSDERDEDRKKRRSDEHDNKKKRKSDEHDDDRRKKRKDEDDAERRKRKGGGEEDGRKKRKSDGEEEDGRKKRKSDGDEEGGRKKRKSEDDKEEETKKSGEDRRSATEDVRKKLKKEQDGSPRGKDTKLTLESPDDGRKSGSGRMEELRKEAKQLQKDIRDSKKRAEGPGKEAKVKAEAEDAADVKDEDEETAEEGDLLALVKKERQKYKMRKKQIGKKENREAATLEILAKFQNRLAAARTLAGDYDDDGDEEKDAEKEEEEDPNDMSWLRHKLHFEDETKKKKVIDANVHDNDRYQLSDPRNPLTQRRRESSKKAMRDKR